MSSHSVLFRESFDDPLFAVAFHPSRPVYTVGCASGRVTSQHYNVGTVTPTITTAWSTKRHRASCRALTYDHSGDYLFSTGSDKVIKQASAETGKVAAKNLDSLAHKPTVIKINEHYLAVGDEAATLRFFDVRSLKETHSFKDIHADHDVITSIIDLAFKNQYHFISTGSTSLAHIDIRKGVIAEAEALKDEFMCGYLASDKYSVYGMSEGTVSVWDNSRLEFGQVSGVNLSDQSIDCLIAGEDDNLVYAGSADGIVHKINARSGKKTDTFVHSKIDEVGMLELDFDYRLVTASTDTLKVWRNASDNDIAETEKRKLQEEDTKPAQPKESKKKQKKAKKGPDNGIATFQGL